jgi:ABC-type transport system involved in multi-copper enzyme maturation permease subunit
MMREIVWKEWRENRWKYMTLWLVFNLPMLLLAIVMGLVRAARTPFADLTNQTVMKYLALPLFMSAMIVTLFLFATGFVGVITFHQEVADKSVFFLFELPAARWRHALAKLANGGLHVALAAIAATLAAPAIAYGLMLLGGKVTVAGSSANFGGVMAAAARASLWVALVSVAAFAGTALIGTLVPRWWLATIVAFGFILGCLRYLPDGDFFDMFSNGPDGNYSVAVNFGTSNWLSVTGILPSVSGFAHWHLVPTLVPLAMLAVFAAGLAWVYERKELT